jgi:protein-S-isoprenylcysteine O-methyltransferase Ste14
MTFMPAFRIGLWNGWIFMVVFLLQMLVMMFIDKRAWQRSHVPSGARRNALEKYAGIAGNFIWLAALGYSVFLPFQLHAIWFYAGLSVFLVGLILLALATYNFIATPPQRLITQGAYRLSRHPMYLATCFICFGCSIACASWLFLVMSIAMAACFNQESLIEERYCLERYGDTYRQYMERTPAWIGLPSKRSI